MYKTLQKRLALSEKGAKDFCKGVFFTTVLDIALMLPAMFFFFFLQDYFSFVMQNGDHTVNGFVHYTVMALVFMIIMYITAILQYKSTFTTIYEESSNRRLSLAEKLRKLPLAFFGEKNLSDLTATIMEDSTELEHTFSHAVPQLFASIISIVIIAFGLFFYNWQMALALFWVVPIAGAIILIAKKMLHKENFLLYKIKRDVTEKIQEGLETIQETKAYNQEAKYTEDLGNKLDKYEKQLIKGELLAGALVNSAQSFLKLGIPSVVIVGATLLISEKTDIFTYLIFLMIASRIYNPINEVFNNLAALFYLDIRINRMNEMQSLPVQNGKTNFSTNSYDITFENVDFAYESGKQVLNNLSFTAKQGEITALVGPSGGGKSTAAKLAARFWDIDSGKIMLGKTNINEIEPETLLKNYSVVFQDVVLFNTSIMENIRIGKEKPQTKKL